MRTNASWAFDQTEPGQEDSCATFEASFVLSSFYFDRSVFWMLSCFLCHFVVIASAFWLLTSVDLVPSAVVSASSAASAASTGFVFLTMMSVVWMQTSAMHAVRNCQHCNVQFPHSMMVTISSNSERVASDTWRHFLTVFLFSTSQQTPPDSET